MPIFISNLYTGRAVNRGGQRRADGCCTKASVGVGARLDGALVDLGRK